MDFFARQEIARRRTWWLVVLFFAALTGIIATTYFACVMIIQNFVQDPTAPQYATTMLWNPSVMGGVSALVSLVVLGGTTFKLAQLKQGGSKVAEMLGGRVLNTASSQFYERRLLNVVEEMALASGVPVPAVYVLSGQGGINAFAAGYSINDAVVGVTEGTMKGLKREELQGVIAHEFSHILNGDMRMNIRLIGIVHGLLVLAIIGRVLLRVSGGARGGGGKKNGGAALIVVLGLALIIVGYAGYFFGGLIKRAVSRQREYLADASAVQFTRNPFGLAGALKKIGGLARGGIIDNNRAEEVSHLFFADGIKRFMGAGSLFSTHPPLEKRVKLLDPTFDGEFPIITEDALALSGQDEQARDAMEKKSREFIKRTVMMGGDLALNPQQIIQQVGVLDAASLDAANGLMAAIPKELRETTRDPVGAQALLLALIISATDQESSTDAWTWIPASLMDSASRSVDLLLNVPDEYRLALVDLSLPALRTLHPGQIERYLETIEQIIDTDKRVDLFEFAVYEIVKAGLREKLDLPFTRITVTSVPAVSNECAVLLSMLASAGHQDQTSIATAFEKGAAQLNGTNITLKPADALTVDDLSRSLSVLLTTNMPVRQKILEAALACLMSDQKATIKELEIFRAFAAALEVPVPPGLMRYTNSE
jgi:Zn-dependent protease with chaperone function